VLDRTIVWPIAGVLANGAVHSNGTSHAPAEVYCTPVLTRLAASPACRQPAQQHLRSFEGGLVASSIPLDSVCLWFACAALQMLLHFEIAYCYCSMRETSDDHSVQASQSPLTNYAALLMSYLIIMARYALLIDRAGLARQMLHRWGYDRDEQADITEQLHQLATGQQQEDDWSD